jgi:hydroxypyruvate isomerase
VPNFAANLTMLYNEHDFLDRFAAAAADGFAGVEFLFPYAYPKEELAARLKAHKLVQALHNLPAGDWAAGERGIACLPGREDEFRESVSRGIEYATALGCKQVNCLAGIPPKDAPAATIRRTFVDNLRHAAPAFAKAGIRLVIEAINTRDIPGFYLSRSAQAIELMDEVGSDNLFLQYDFYHMQIMEGDLVPTFRRLKDRIGHVQIADNPGRNEPGTGEINYPFILGALDAAGYDRWVGCEYKPATTTTAGLGWFAPHRRRAA